MSTWRTIGAWLASPAARGGLACERHVRRLLHAQRDLVSEEGRRELEAALRQLRAAWAGGSPRAAIRAAMAEAREVQDRWLVDTARHRVRELNEMFYFGLLVVITLRTFFVEPMRIPTGSMEPTLSGIRVEDLRERADVGIPVGLARWVELWVHGHHYLHVVAEAAGRLEQIGPIEPLRPWLKGLPAFRKQRFRLGGIEYTVVLPPGELPEVAGLKPGQLLFYHGGVKPDRYYRAGDDILRMRVHAGDHLLVDRFTYNFRHPRRGEIVVFVAEGIRALHEGGHYIKRLVGLGGERVRIGDDRHLVINGCRLDGQTPGFEGIYSFTGRPAHGGYSGHLNDATAVRFLGLRPGSLAPRFPDGRAEFRVRPGHYLVMGDNTVSSYDGRRWGDFPNRNVTGRALVVYWPRGDRSGWVHR